jgi:hypothetical protein
MREAASTLDRSRSVANGPQGMRVAWPTVLHDRNEAYGYNAVMVPRIEPSAAELAAMEKVLEWSSRYLCVAACQRAGLPDDTGMMVWLRARGLSIARIAKQRQRSWKGRVPTANSRESVRLVIARAHQHVADQLNGASVPLTAGSARAPANPPSVLRGRHETLPRAMDTRIWVLNERPCGECRHMKIIRAVPRCGQSGAEVVAEMPARHPQGQPCFEEKAP